MKLQENFSVQRILPSLIATPWLLMVSTAVTLYLKNQADLYYHYEVVYPYLGAALVIYSIGALAALSAKRFRALIPVVWAYYLLAPLFIILQNTAGDSTNASFLSIRSVALAAVFLGAVLVLNRKVELTRAAPVFTLIGCAFVLTDSYNFLSQISHQSAFTRAKSDGDLQVGFQEKPNIYHIVLDEYQVDLFELTLNPQVKNKLAGFTLFSDATALFGRTEMSLPSIFSGMDYDFESPPLEYQQAAFARTDSLLATLKDHGYETHGIMHPVFKFDLEGFDSMAFHKKGRIPDHGSIDRSFFTLWAYSLLPENLIRQFIEPIELDQLKYKNMLTRSAPIESYESMLRITEAEKSLRGSNRYYFIHLLLPHFPYVLSDTCTYAGDDRTSPVEQSKCATKLVTDFVATLKNLGRFKDSMIIVQSDHGARYEINEGKLQGVGESDAIRFTPKYARARSRSLLMIKPAGTGASSVFTVSGIKASLLDIAPTIVDSVGLASDQLFDGHTLLDPNFSDIQRQRYYYFYNKRGTEGTHIDKMTRYRVEAPEYINEGLVKSGEFY